MSERTYTGQQLDVAFDGARCLHAAECVRGLPSVFDTERKPWILPDGAEAEELADVVARCPSGALHVRRTSIDVEPHGPASVDAGPGQPLFLRGDVTLAGGVAETRAALCTCGQTANNPFCDASGPCTAWRD